MSNKNYFSYTVEKDDETGWAAIVTLRYDNPDDVYQNKIVKVCPDAGSNLFYWKVGEYEIIHQPSSLKDLPGYNYGIPVLYPTPSLVRNIRYIFMGEEIHQVKNGKKYGLHGLVFDEPWNYEEPLVSESGITLKTSITFTKESKLFPAFPFENTLRLSITLLKDRLRFDYEVDNLGGKPLPYGFGLHPYFKTFGEREDNLIQAEVEKAYTTIDLLPTGELYSVEGTIEDIRNPTSLANLDLDHVYYGVTPETNVRAIFNKIHLQVSLKASKDFINLVVYTPINEKFFCIENYTCPTDAHNLYAKGFKDVAHLLIVEPKEKMSGWVEYVTEWIDK